MERQVLYVLCCFLATACTVSPREGDPEGPTITISQMTRGDVTAILSTDPSMVFDAPDVCPSGIVIVGTAWQVDGWPVQLLVSASDRDGVRWLRVNSERGQLRNAEPATTEIRSLSVAGRDFSQSWGDYAGDAPTTPRLYSVSLEPKPGESVVDIEGGAEDFLGNDVYTLVLDIGTHEALCERFAP